MIFKLLACDVITREVCHCIARSVHTIDPQFTPKGEHNASANLRALLQAQIDAVAAGNVEYDAVLLGYGLCGNSTLGLEARRFPLVIPRAHDCTTLFLGSKEAFQEHFGPNPSQTWASVGYSERGGSVLSDSSTRDWLGGSQSFAELAAIYGEENAQFILDTLRVTHDSDSIWFIDVPETRAESVIARIEEQARQEKKEIRKIAGSIRMIEGLLSGNWPESDYLVVPPGHRVAGVYDMEEVVRAEPVQ